MTSLLLAIVAASFAGSLHCATMCGPFVAFYAAGSTGHGRVLAHVAYQLGRLSAYALLGAGAGAVGAALDLAGSAAGVGRVAGVIAGGVMIVWGLGMLLSTHGVQLLRMRLPQTVTARIATRIAALRAKPPTARAALLGLSTALLPCGWLYAFAVTAASTASPLAGAAVLAAFWSGSLPILLGIGVGVQSVSARVSRHVPLVTASVLLVMGLVAVTGRVNAPALALDAINPPNGAASCH